MTQCFEPLDRLPLEMCGFSGERMFSPWDLGSKQQGDMAFGCFRSKSLGRYIRVLR